MKWIAVHDNVTGGKLRCLRIKLNCSEVEAIGILVLLWLWARKNADEDGRIPNTSLEEVEVVFSSSLPDGITPEDVVSALDDAEWIEQDGDSVIIHDWYEWQKYSYSYEAQKVKDRERQRKFREKKKAVNVIPKEECHGDSHGDSHGDKPDVPAEEPKPKKKSEKEPKKKYAEFVSMTEAEYKKLIDASGEPFAKKCIEVLDNYKGSKGKKYKEDYRAILSWVVDSVREKNPELVRRKDATPFSGNPFR